MSTIRFASGTGNRKSPRLRQRKTGQADLKQQEQQLRALQFELLQLQNQLIDGQLATRELIGDLQIPGQQESALQSLKFELNQRFDHVMVTWREFAARFQLAVESVSKRQ